MSLFASLRHRPLLFLALLTCALGAPSAHAADAANGSGHASGARSGRWAHENGSGLTPDPRVIWGRLDNGLRYALLPHKGVPGSVSIRLLVLSGSVDEREDERGIAHFTEHMCFRGTRRFKYEDMVGFFQRLGMQFGSDVNAFTTHDRTVYELELRDNSPALINEGLALFRDMVDTVVFDPTFIARERFVVLSELRLRSGITARKHEAAFPLIYRGLTFADRSPIGTADAIRSFDQRRFLEFYHRCYRPELAVIVLAGDIDPAAAAARIREEFGTIEKRTDAVAPRVIGKMDTKRALRAESYKTTELGAVSIVLASVAAPAAKPDSRERRIESTRRNFAMQLLSGRLGSLVDGSSEGAAMYDNMLGYDTSMAAVSTSAMAWSTALTSADEVIRATCERGFETREFEQAKKNTARLLGHWLEQAPTIDPRTLSSDLVESIADHRVYLGFVQSNTLAKEAIDTLTPAIAQQSLKSSWELERLAVHIAGDVTIEGGSAAIAKKLETARKSVLRTLHIDTRRESIFSMQKWGEPAAVVERREVPELGAVLLRFGNNVRLNLVSSRQEPGLAHMIVRVGNGILDMPGNQPALKEFGLQTLLASGVGGLTSERIGEIIEDHFMSFSLDVDDNDAFAFRAFVDIEHLDSFLGLTTEFLHKPRFEMFAHREVKVMAALGRIMSSIGMPEAFRALDNHLFKGDPRLTWGTFNNYIGMSTVDVRNWLQPALTKGYVELTIVGDVDEADMIARVSRTLGSLAPRAATKAPPINTRAVAVVAAAGFQRMEFIGEQHQAMVVANWPVQAQVTTRDTAALHILSKILDTRMRERIRDELGLAYSPSTTFDGYDGFPGFGLLQTVVDCAPDESTRIARLAAEIAAAVARDGVTEGDFVGSRGVLAGQLRGAFLENGFLIDQLKRAQEKPAGLDEPLALKAGLVDQLTREEVNAWAARILPATNCRSAALVPKPLIGLFDSGGR